MSEQNWETNFNDGSPKNVYRLYIKRLYSETIERDYYQQPKTIIHPNIKILFEKRIRDRLIIERKARIQNLYFLLSRSCPRFFSSVDKKEALGHLVDFCNSPEFWDYQGRSLAENFCLWFYYNNVPSILSETVKIDGIISGIFHHPEKISPWKSHEFENSSQLKERGILARETFTSSCFTINDLGQLKTTKELEKQKGNTYTIIVWLTEDRHLKFQIR